jgi:two-component system phosphate regulon response regulator OmpR
MLALLLGIVKKFQNLPIFWHKCYKCKPHYYNFITLRKERRVVMQEVTMENQQKHDNLGVLPHVLVIDDDDRIRSLVARYLTENGFFVSTAEDALKAKEILQSAEYDVLVVDVMMPGQDGMGLTDELRRQGNDIPVLLLTAMGEVEDKIKGLSSGADDYLTKPFDPRELVLRLQAILRRKPKPQALEDKIQIGRWMYYSTHGELVDDAGGRVKLTDGEVTLLKALLQKKGEIIDRDSLSKFCDMDPNKRTIDVQVTRLRRKLEEDSNMPRYLLTVRGKGYVLRTEDI